jgi:4'-phosphopantetheinyl transferase
VRTVDVWRLSLSTPEKEEFRRAVRGRLADYLGVTAGAVEVTYGSHGQPRLANAGGLTFSASHSGRVGLLAVTRGREIGVDVERVEPARALGPIADHHFAVDEAAELRALPDDRRIERFFELWTGKEAYAKALGVGFAMPLARLRAPGGWSLHALDPVPGYAGAVCVRGRRVRLRMLG